MGEGVASGVGDSDTPGRPRVTGGLGGEGAGQSGVDGPEPGGFAGMFGQAEQGGQRDRQVDPGAGMTRRSRVSAPAAFIGLAVAAGLTGLRVLANGAGRWAVCGRSAVTVVLAFAARGASIAWGASIAVRAIAGLRGATVLRGAAIVRSTAIVRGGTVLSAAVTGLGRSAVRGPFTAGSVLTAGGVCGGLIAGGGVLAEEGVEVGADAELVGGAGDPGCF